MHLNVTLEGLDEVLDALGAYGSQVDGALKSAMESATRFVVNEAKRNAPVRSGDLRNSIHGRVTGGEGAWVGEITAGVEYAAYVEFGTGPRGYANHAGAAEGATYATRKWRGKVGGKWRMVSGMAARPYLYPAVVAAKPKLRAAIRRALAKLK